MSTLALNVSALGSIVPRAYSLVPSLSEIKGIGEAGDEATQATTSCFNVARKKALKN